MICLGPVDAKSGAVVIVTVPDFHLTLSRADEIHRPRDWRLPLLLRPLHAGSFEQRAGKGPLRQVQRRN